MKPAAEHIPVCTGPCTHRLGVGCLSNQQRLAGNCWQRATAALDVRTSFSGKNLWASVRLAPCCPPLRHYAPKRGIQRL